MARKMVKQALVIVQWQRDYVYIENGRAEPRIKGDEDTVPMRVARRLVSMKMVKITGNADDDDRQIVHVRIP